MRESRLPEDIRKAIERTPIQFWTCLNRDHQTVTWNGDVASCDTCGLTSEMTQRFIGSIRRHTAEHLLKVAEIARGVRCPVCHGRPAVDPRFGAKPRFRCGAGHTWDRQRVTPDPSANVEILLARLADTGEMPVLPPRRDLEDFDV